MKNLNLGFIIASCIAGSALANNIPAYEETGVITMTLGPTQMTHYTTWNTVPGDADRQIHTASWIIQKPIMLGGIKLSTDDALVTITARDSILPDHGQPTLRVEFALDPITFALNTEVDVNLLYYPTDSDLDGYYALTNGQFKIEIVTRIDENTLSIIATAEGEMSAQTGYDVAHNPNDVLPLNARFDLKRVVNRSDISLP